MRAGPDGPGQRDLRTDDHEPPDGLKTKNLDPARKLIQASELSPGHANPLHSASRVPHRNRSIGSKHRMAHCTRNRARFTAPGRSWLRRCVGTSARRRPEIVSVSCVDRPDHGPATHERRGRVAMRREPRPGPTRRGSCTRGGRQAPSRFQCLGRAEDRRLSRARVRVLCPQSCPGRGRRRRTRPYPHSGAG